MSAAVTIRPLHTIEEFREVITLEQEIWGAAVHLLSCGGQPAGFAAVLSGRPGRGPGLAETAALVRARYCPAAHLPLAVRHRPAGERRYSPEDYVDPCRTFPGNAFMLGLIASCPAPDPSSGPDARLSVLGRYFHEVAADAQGFATLLNSAWQAYLRHHHALVVRALNERRDWPDWWQTAMTTILQHLARHMSSNARIPLEYAAGSGAAAMESLRRDVGTFGRLLQSWPAVRHAADQLSARLAAEPQRLRP